MGWISMPGVSSGTRNMVSPRCLADLGIGAGEEEDVLREVCATREHLLAVDDPVVAVADGAGLRGSDVRARLGLGVSE